MRLDDPRENPSATKRARLENERERGPDLATFGNFASSSRVY